MQNRLKTQKTERRLARKAKTAERTMERRIKKHALHEAGHIVSDWVFGIPVEYAWVDARSGYTHGLGATWFGDPANDLPIYEKAIRAMVALIAGLAAELGATGRFGQAPHEAVAAAMGDIDQFSGAFRELHITSQCDAVVYGGVLERMRSEAALVLDACSDSFLAVTTALTDKRKLSSRDLNDLLGNAADVRNARANWEREQRATLILGELRILVKAPIEPRRC